MGIQGLLKVVAPIMDEGHVRDFVGKRVGIDSFSWLHKGAFACAYELAMGIPTDKYIKYCLNRCLMMKSHRVTPVMIFDGCDMPGKKGTNEERARSRRTHMALGQNLVQQERRGHAILPESDHHHARDGTQVAAGAEAGADRIRSGAVRG
jgi:exonuclease-1